MKSCFEFFLTSSSGEIISKPVRVYTEEGVILQCDPRIPQSKIRHLCALARTHADYPVDITHFDLNDFDEFALVWSARIYWRADGVQKIESAITT